VKDKEAALATRIAAEYGVTNRTAQLWLRKFGVPDCSDRRKLAELILAEPRSGQHARNVAMSIAGRRKQGRQKTVKRLTQDERSGTVSGSSAVEKAQNGLAKECGRLEGYLTDIDAQIAEARPTGNQGLIASLMGQYKAIHASLVQNRVAQGRLGLETGEMISKEQFRKIINAFASRSALGISRMRDALAVKLVGLKTPNEAADVLEPAVILAGMLDPFAASANLASGVGLPEWVVETMVTAVGDHIGAGEKWLSERRVNLKQEEQTE